MKIKKQKTKILLFNFRIKIENWNLKKNVFFQFSNLKWNWDAQKTVFPISISQWKLNGTFVARIKCNPKFFYTHKKTFSSEKVYRSFVLTLKVFYQFFKKSSVANNSITILGYSNDKKYVYCKEYYFDWLVDSLCKIRHVWPTEFDP